MAPVTKAVCRQPSFLISRGGEHTIHVEVEGTHMAENEKKKDDPLPEAAPTPADPKELADENLEKVSGGMGAAVPQFNRASSLRGLAEPCCLSQS